MNKQKENNKKTWLEQQPTEFIKNLKSVQTITYPDGKEEHLNGTFFIL
jgi:hypothetical protein